MRASKWGFDYSEYEEFTREDSPAYFYPVGYTHAGEHMYLWKPGIKPWQEYQRFKKWLKRERLKGAFFATATTRSVDDDLWAKELDPLVRLPRGEEAREIVELLFGIQMSRSVKKGKTPRAVLRELHQVSWDALSDYDGSPTMTAPTATAAVRAVAKKIGTIDSRANLFEDLKAIDRFLKEQG